MADNIYLRLALKAFLFWLAFSLAGFFWGDRLVQALLPFYEWTIEQLNGDYHIDTRIDGEPGSKNVVMAATALRNVAILPDRNLEAGKTIESSITVLHALVPLVILLTTLCVFPLNNLKQRAVLLALGIPALFLVSALTAPPQLLGNLEIGFINAAAKHGFMRERSMVLEWMLMTEGGGRWLIPILVGVLCGAAVRSLGRGEPAKQAV